MIYELKERLMRNELKLTGVKRINKGLVYDQRQQTVTILQKHRGSNRSDGSSEIEKASKIHNLIMGIHNFEISILIKLLY